MVAANEVNWRVVDNGITERMIDGSLIHLFDNGPRKIDTKTQLINLEISKIRNTNYETYVKAKQKAWKKFSGEIVSSDGDNNEDIENNNNVKKSTKRITKRRVKRTKPSFDNIQYNKFTLTKNTSKGRATRNSTNQIQKEIKNDNIDRKRRKNNILEDMGMNSIEKFAICISNKQNDVKNVNDLISNKSDNITLHDSLNHSFNKTENHKIIIKDALHIDIPQEENTDIIPKKERTMVKITSTQVVIPKYTIVRDPQKIIHMDIVLEEHPTTINPESSSNLLSDRIINQTSTAMCDDSQSLSNKNGDLPENENDDHELHDSSSNSLHRSISQTSTSTSDNSHNLQNKNNDLSEFENKGNHRNSSSSNISDCVSVDTKNTPEMNRESKNNGRKESISSCDNEDSQSSQNESSHHINLFDNDLNGLPAHLSHIDGKVLKKKQKKCMIASDDEDNYTEYDSNGSDDDRIDISNKKTGKNLQRMQYSDRKKLKHALLEERMALQFVLSNISRQKSYEDQKSFDADFYSGNIVALRNDIFDSFSDDSSGSQKSKIYKIPTTLSELERIEDLVSPQEKASTITLNDLTGDDEIFVMEIPKTIIDQEQLIEQQMKIKKNHLIIGDSKYKLQHRKEETLTWIFKETNEIMSFKAVNIKPFASFLVKRRCLSQSVEKCPPKKFDSTSNCVPKFPTKLQIRNPLSNTHRNTLNVDNQNVYRQKKLKLK